jgi:hypothetical protein
MLDNLAKPIKSIFIEHIVRHLNGKSTPHIKYNEKIEVTITTQVTMGQTSKITNLLFLFSSN